MSVCIEDSERVEVVLIPHADELKKLADAQRTVCAALTAAGNGVWAPCLPLYVRDLALAADADGSGRARLYADGAGEHVEMHITAAAADGNENLRASAADSNGGNSGVVTLAGAASAADGASLLTAAKGFSCVIQQPVLSDGVVSARAVIAGDGFCGTGTLALARRLRADAGGAVMEAADAAGEAAFTGAPVAGGRGVGSAGSGVLATSVADGGTDGAVQAALDDARALFPLRLPVFRVAQVRFAGDERACSWEVLSARWVKAAGAGRR